MARSAAWTGDTGRAPRGGTVTAPVPKLISIGPDVRFTSRSATGSPLHLIRAGSARLGWLEAATPTKPSGLAASAVAEL